MSADETLREAIERLASRLLKFDVLNEQVPAHVDVPDDYEAGVNEAGRHLRALLAEHPATPAEERKWIAFPGKVPVCRDCGTDWRPVRRGECAKCGSDSGPLGADRAPNPKAAEREALVGVIWDGFSSSPFIDITRRDAQSIATTVLTSDWLRDHAAALTAKAKAEALREAAAWVSEGIGYPAECKMPDHPMPRALWDALVNHIHTDESGKWHGNTLDREDTEWWLADEAGRTHEEDS